MYGLVWAYVAECVLKLRSLQLRLAIRFSLSAFSGVNVDLGVLWALGRRNTTTF